MADEPTPTKSLSVSDLDAAMFQSALSSETIKLLIGPKRKAFVVHKDLVGLLVPEFAKLFARRFQGPEAGDIYLGDQDPAVIQLFVGWLYRGAPALYVAEKNLVPLSRLYATAAKWSQPALQNAIVDVLVAHFRDVADGDLQPICEVVDRYYKEIGPYREFRSLLMFHTAVAFNQLSRISPLGALIGLRALLKSNEKFAVGFGIWQMVNADMIQATKLAYVKGINKKYHV